MLGNSDDVDDDTLVFDLDVVHANRRLNGRWSPSLRLAATTMLPQIGGPDVRLLFDLILSIKVHCTYIEYIEIYE